MTFEVISSCTIWQQVVLEINHCVSSVHSVFKIVSKKGIAYFKAPLSRLFLSQKTKEKEK